MIGGGLRLGARYERLSKPTGACPITVIGFLSGCANALDWRHYKFAAGPCFGGLSHVDACCTGGAMTRIDLKTLAKNSPADGTQNGIYWCCLAVAAVGLGLF